MILINICLEGKKIPTDKTVKEKKLGFPLPMNDWMRDEKVKEILLDKRQSIEKFSTKTNRKFIFEKFKNDLTSGKNMMILNLELWMRSNFNKNKLANSSCWNRL